MDILQRIWTAVKRLWKKAHMNQIVILIVSVGLLVFLAFFAYFASTVNIAALKKGLSQSTEIIDKDGNVASRISSTQMDHVSIKEVPKNMQDAIVAIEDHRFYQHHGFDIIGTTSALLKDITAGGVRAGGSTITQQLTKNALLTSQRTFKRKIEELFLAVEIEKHYTKSEILEMYLNQVYFGSGAWGIQNASRRYFGTDVQNIDLSEAATLAGLVNAPTALNPYLHMDSAINRRNLVLGAMKKYGMITDSQYNSAVAEKLVLKDKGEDPLKGKYPYYVDAVINEAMSKYGLSQDEILTRGYKIYTELDQNIQSGLERVYKNDSLFPQGMGGQMVQSGAVLMDPHTGGVRALVGGRGEKVFLGFNRATQLQRQPGSTMKPLAVYTPALEQGYTPESMLNDTKMSFGSYHPQNYDNQYLGQVPMYRALEDSINIPAVWLLDQIGIDKGMDAVKRFGLPLTNQDRQLGLALGGIQNGVSPFQMAQAFSTFPNNGVEEKGHLITKIIGPTGNVIAQNQQQETKVTSKKVTDQMTSMMLNVVESGTGKGINVPGYRIAGKSGSTQVDFSRNGTKDQWFVGYTPNLVGAVWLGYDRTDPQHYLMGLSEQGVVPIFQAVMQNTLHYTKPGSFDAQSVNQILKQQQATTNHPFTERAKEFNQKMQQEAQNIKKKIEENKGRWKDLEDTVRNFLSGKH
ncbi:transglycosylase domain-containing protein [Heyndrickxia acidicola]|uniref:PBP1A family penicillin-binding protein n=1 Tax=Heyndrickxia acidicola TaxID=209389 RepID=A0ABU6MDC2_9BACI|nr:PBP1A family penicillin-binding protein [Heyndrickxia acidicola]MED1202402.1 PBP1A family penicillin-binding protein [Heyndrickxia acidicola]